MKIRFHIPENLDRRKPHVWLASWFGCGFLSPAPGTWGSLGALPFGLLILAIGGIYGLIAGIIIVTLIGLWAADKFDKDMDGHDSKMIVIDEVAGMWIALLPAGFDPMLILVAFIGFRAFDITKPWPACYFDKSVKGAAGVMGDDLVAGVMAAFCVSLITLLLS